MSVATIPLQSINKEGSQSDSSKMLLVGYPPENYLAAVPRIRLFADFFCLAIYNLFNATNIKTTDIVLI